jgi:hypothetical protein
MSFARSLATFILSFLFVSSILFAITSYNIGNLVQKVSIKIFIKSQSTNFIDQQCEENCKDYPDYKDLCIQQCLAEATNQTESGISKAVDEIYEQKFFDLATLEDISSLLTHYLLFLIIGIVCSILIFVASKTPFQTLGKGFISISISLFISSVTPQFMLASINLPFDLGKAIKDYFFTGFNQLIYYGIAFLIVGIILIIVNYLLAKRKEPTKKKDEDKSKK